MEITEYHNALKNIDADMLTIASAAADKSP